MVFRIHSIDSLGAPFESLISKSYWAGKMANLTQLAVGKKPVQFVNGKMEMLQSARYLETISIWKMW